MEMITGSKITGFLWSPLIVDWPLSVSLLRAGGDFSGLYGLAVVKWLKNISEMKSCIQPSRKNGTWKHFSQISGAPVSHQAAV